MLSQPPPQLSIPRFIPPYNQHIISHPKQQSIAQPYYSAARHILAVDGSPIDSPTDEEHLPSPLSTQPPSENYTYAPRNSTASFDPPVSPVQIYHTNQNQAYTTPAPATHHFSSASDATEQASYDINSSAPTATTDSGPMNAFLEKSPSPVDPHRSLSALHSQERFLHSDAHPYPVEDPILSQPDSGSERTSRQHQRDKYSNPNLPNSLLDQRRMSEPVALSGPAIFATSASDPSMASRYQHFDFAYNPPALHHSRSSASLYVSPLQRGASTGSLRDVRHHHFGYLPQQQEWKHDDSRQREHQQPEYFDHRTDTLDDPVSPMQNTFAHNLLGSPTSGLPYSPISDNLYGPSPPGTGTSTSSSVAPMSAGLPCSPSRSISQHLQRSLSTSQLSNDGIDRKTYSFVALPGNTVKKRPRRRYDEIERLYLCSWPDCNKSYGTLNHLNAHVTMQKHGSKRSPNEFKELRKQWRKAKKEQEASAAAMHRDSFSDGYDDHQGFNHRYLGTHHALQHHRHLPSSVTIGTAERYSVAIDEIRYPPQDRDDGLGVYEPALTARQRYGGNVQPASWHGGSNLSARANAVQQPSYNSYNNSPTTSLPTQHAHHSQLPQLDMGGGRLQPHPSTVPDHQSAPMQSLSNSQQDGGRLPQNSTLLTPLPGYPTSSLMPSLHNGGGNVAYTTEGYELYETDIDNGSRPGTGHASLGGHASADEFSH
ncbi:hypothetical protein BDZ97DRAFT_1917704 [Flammula alnicola]|nr:hypothetical protein BDZ97DRAFT_1917704 [Flammula alnicola]